MNAFRTHIVETKEISKTIRILAGMAILVSAYFLFIDRQEYDAVFLNILRFVYFGALLLGFGLPFRKPTKTGNLQLDEQGIKFSLQEEEKSIGYSEIKRLKLKYKGYGSWWSHSIYGNKNYLKVVTTNNEEYSFEILIKNREHKNLLKELLAVPRKSVKMETLQTGTKFF